jgi:hypothetical protein
MPFPIPPPDDDDGEVPSFDDVLDPESVQALAARSVRRGLTSAFQGLLAALVEAVTEAAVPVHTAASAAISLAQQTHVAAVADRLDAAVEALRSGLTDQGLALLPAPPRTGWFSRADPDPVPLAWADAMFVAEAAVALAAETAATLAAAQPDGSSARILGEGVAVRLLADRDALVDEATRTGE